MYSRSAIVLPASCPVTLPPSVIVVVFCKILFPNIMGLHESMFIPTILQQGTPPQMGRWLTLAKSYGIVGKYAQTELGHGKKEGSHV